MNRFINLKKSTSLGKLTNFVKLKTSQKVKFFDETLKEEFVGTVNVENLQIAKQCKTIFLRYPFL